MSLPIRTEERESPTPHEFVTVGGRRWCLNCDLFQSKRRDGWPAAIKACPRNTPHALGFPAHRYHLPSAPTCKAPT